MAYGSISTCSFLRNFLLRSKFIYKWLIKNLRIWFLFSIMLKSNLKYRKIIQFSLCSKRATRIIWNTNLFTKVLCKISLRQQVRFFTNISTYRDFVWAEWLAFYKELKWIKKSSKFYRISKTFGLITLVYIKRISMFKLRLLKILLNKNLSL